MQRKLMLVGAMLAVAALPARFSAQTAKTSTYTMSPVWYLARQLKTPDGRWCSTT